MTRWRELEIELTTICNARCPFCNRASLSNLKPTNLDFSILYKVPFDQFKFIGLCGNRGDPMCYPKLFELITYIKDVTYHNTSIVMQTNGGIHSFGWWAELGELMRYHTDNHVVFALDGLEDTHSLHRVGTDFNRVVQNIEAFIRAGGRAIIQFIVFEHNEHQLEDVKRLSKSLGCVGFWKRQSRCFTNELKRPINSHNTTRKELNSQSMNKDIICDMIHRDKYYVTVYGEIRPCCFMGDDDYINDFTIFFKDQIKDLFGLQYIGGYKNNPKENNLYHNSFETAINSRYIQSIWKYYEHIHRCKEKCHTNFNEIVDHESL